MDHKYGLWVPLRPFQKKRFDIIPHRNSANLKLFAMNHILPGTHITHDGWAGYNF